MPAFLAMCVQALSIRCPTFFNPAVSPPSSKRSPHSHAASLPRQATSETWLVDAARAGALILAGVHADRILVEPHPDPLSARQHMARGVVATTGGGRRLVVEARVTVAAAGSLHTPPLLLRRYAAQCPGACGLWGMTL